MKMKEVRATGQGAWNREFRKNKGRSDPRNPADGRQLRLLRYRNRLLRSNGVPVPLLMPQDPLAEDVAAGGKETAISRHRHMVADLLAGAAVAIDGPQPWDIQVRDERLFARVLREKESRPRRGLHGRLVGLPASG
ncbi:MAG: hypothetical protein MZV70_74790 [Desulfobacterales bacterium]|nr:hypothetical protein [Desulfobacterales bacterium]